MGYRGTACLTMVFSMGCRGISALAPGAPSAPPSSLTLVSAELFLSHHLAPLSQLLLHSNFYLFLNMLTGTLPTLLMGSALARGGTVLELAGTVSFQHRGSFGCLVTEATAISPLLPKPCCINQMQ